MAKAPEPALLVVKTPFACALGVFLEGEIIDADNPVVKRYGDHFGPLVVQHRTQPVIEQATAAPGEKRGA